jgi:hypothetical protein
MLDSQQPRFIISVANDMKALENGGHLIFPAQDNTFAMGIESYEPATGEIARLKRENPQWFKGMRIVSCIRIHPRKPAVQVGAPWKLEGGKLDTWTQLRRYATAATVIYAWSAWEPKFKVVERLHGWMRVLQYMVQSNGNRAFWAYDRSKPQNSGDESSRRPELTWLRNPKDNSYCKWVPADPFFYDEHERKWRLLEASHVSPLSLP